MRTPRSKPTPPSAGLTGPLAKPFAKLAPWLASALLAGSPLPHQGSAAIASNNYPALEPANQVQPAPSQLLAQATAVEESALEALRSAETRFAAAEEAERAADAAARSAEASLQQVTPSPPFPPSPHSRRPSTDPSSPPRPPHRSQPRRGPPSNRRRTRSGRSSGTMAWPLFSLHMHSPTSN